MLSGGKTSPLILLAIWRGDGALVQSHAFCFSTSTIEYIQSSFLRCRQCSFLLQTNKEYLRNNEIVMLSLFRRSGFATN